MSDDRRRLELLYQKYEREASRSLSLYLDNVVVDSVPEPRPFGRIREPWQKQREEWLVPSIEFVAGLKPDYTGPMNYWLGYAKGHDKSGFIARLLNWLLAFSKRPLRCFCGAKDAEQAGLILDFARKQADLNPWLDRKLEFKRNQIVGKDSGSQLFVLASDAGGSQGKTPDLVIADELCHWESQDFFDSLFSGVTKRGGHCAFIVLTNAGYLGTWQDRLRQAARTEHGKRWFFYEQPVRTQLATWMRSEDIAANRGLLAPTEARRLYDNEWLDLTEDRGFLKAEDVDACVGRPEQPPPGATVYLGIDYGGVCDRTALAVVWFDGEKLHVNELTVWQGSRVDEIQVVEIDNWVDRKLQQYPNAVCVFDKHQLLATIQRLENAGHSVKRFDYKGGRQNFAMAENLRTLITNRKIVWAKDCGLLAGETLSDELKRLIIKQVQTWYRMDHETKQHDDRAVAVGMAALEAVANGPSIVVKQRQSPGSQIAQGPPQIGGGFRQSHLSRRKLFGL